MDVWRLPRKVCGKQWRGHHVLGWTIMLEPHASSCFVSAFFYFFVQVGAESENLDCLNIYWLQYSCTVCFMKTNSTLLHPYFIKVPNQFHIHHSFLTNSKRNKWYGDHLCHVWIGEGMVYGTQHDKVIQEFKIQDAYCHSSCALLWNSLESPLWKYWTSKYNL